MKFNNFFHVQRSLFNSFEFVLILVTINTTLLVEGSNGVTNNLFCYQCKIHGLNESSCDGNLRRCPGDQAYDRCLINITKNQTSGEFLIIKRCALAPCEFDETVEKTLGFVSKCILPSKDPDCIHCCSEDGCNRRVKPTLAKQMATSPSISIKSYKSKTFVLILTKIILINHILYFIE